MCHEPLEIINMEKENNIYMQRMKINKGESCSNEPLTTA